MIRPQQGYTLLEVVVAFAILTLSLSALFESFSMTLRRSEKARNLSRAALVAETVRDRLVVELPVTPSGSEGKDEDCRWGLHTAPIEHKVADRPPSVAALKVEIDVTCGAAGSIGSATIDTIQLVPVK